MKYAKKGFLVVLSFMILVLSAATVYAAPRWNYLITIGSNLEFSGDFADVNIVCDADAFDVDKITVKTELQKFDGSWKTVKSWSESRNASTIRYSKSYAVAKNYSYRVKVTASVYKDSKLLETVVDEGPYEFFQ